MVDIKFVAHIEGMDQVKEICPQPSIKFIPPHWKDIPMLIDNPVEMINQSEFQGKYFGVNAKRKTAKKCPSFIDVFTNGYVIPAPCDIYFSYNTETEEWYVETGLKYSGRNQFEAFDIPFSVHDTHQYLDHVPDAPFDYIFKMDNVWSCITPKGYSIMQLPMLWHHNPYFEVAYGIIHTDQYHQINLQIMMRKGVGNFEIKMGDPLCYIIPYKREEYNYTIEPYDTAFHNAANMRNIGKFTNGYKQLFRKLNKEEYKEL